jgi:DNA (cytosine-5)-methyltransferase 1
MDTAIDIFAGWGGFTLGAEMAGVSVRWAGNHWCLAVEAHQFNHPDAIHVCQDLRQADWGAIPPYDLLLAAPACQGHSTASQPKRRLYHDALRATAWVVDCADFTSPRAIIVENVPAFLRWRLYPVWKKALEALGYHIQEVELLATDHGVPQRRRRVFVVATRKKVRLEIPRAAGPEPAFGPCIDWKDGRWRQVKDAGVQARSRIACGRKRHGRRFVIQHVTGHCGLPLTDAVRTITTQDQWAVVDGARYRPFTVRETARAMGFPEDYGWPPGAGRGAMIRGLGNAVCPPVARDIVAAVRAAV